jgi:hypothetical protein
MRVRKALKGVGIVIGVFSVVALVLIYLVLSNIGDPPDVRGVPIVNRTDQTLTIHSVSFYFPSGTPTLSVGPDGPNLVSYGEVPPGGQIETPGPCILSSRLVARTRDGTVVARLGPFKQCHSQPWVIIEAGDQD